MFKRINNSRRSQARKSRQARRARRPVPRSAYIKGQKLKSSRLERIAYSLEHSKFLDYLEFAKKPHWLIIRNFAIGAARGVGLTIGTALVIAIAIKILQHLISMNIPYLTEALTDFVLFVKSAATAVPGAADSLSDGAELLNATNTAGAEMETVSKPMSLRIDKSLAN